MYVLLWTVLFICVVAILYLSSIKPGKYRPEILKPFENTYIAHRGYHDNDAKIPENSIIAFKKAVDMEFGIELDVQLTKDHKLIVFHDNNLERMCNEKILVKNVTYDQLQKYRLLDTEYDIPLLSDVLKVVDGSVPILVEIKDYNGYKNTAKILYEHMKKYDGIYAVESFHPGAIKTYRRLCPEVSRGILASDYMRKPFKMNPFIGFFVSNLMFNWIVKPDFIAYNHKYKRQISYRLLRGIYKVKNAAWTIRSMEQLENARDIFTMFIFDSFNPQK